MFKSRHGRRQHAAIQNLAQRIQRELRAAILDREADRELQHGHHVAAERLAWQAAELREGAR